MKYLFFRPLPFFRLDNSEPGYDDRIELKVYGITCPGTQITHDLVELLDRKLVMKLGIKSFITYIVSRKEMVVYHSVRKMLKRFAELKFFPIIIQNEKVVEVISVMLQRNPMCKLTPEDVRFLQKPGPNSSPSSVYRLFANFLY
jgi:hypothetical protein